MKKNFTKFLVLLLGNLLLLSNVGLLSNIAQAGYSVIPAPPATHFFSLEIKPGEEKKASLIIENFSAESVNIDIYGADGTQSDQGTYGLTTRATPQNHIGKWLTFNQPTITLGPKEKREIPFIIKVPKDATPGTYSGGIAAETGSAPASPAGAKTGTQAANPGGNAVSVTSRFVVKVFVKVPGEKIYKYEWDDFSFHQDPGSAPYISLKYKNLGNTIIRAEQKVEITGFPPLSAPQKNKQKYQDGNLLFELQPATLLQNSDASIPIRWDNPPDFGFYRITATVVFSEYDLNLNKQINQIEETRTIGVFIPLKWSSMLGVSIIFLALVALALAMFFALRSIFNSDLLKSCKTYTIKSGDTLVDLAEGTAIGWKKLAKINKIKAPYNLKAGQKILLPAQKAAKNSKNKK